ncbi:MAG: dCTP deaminase [Candidatus Methylarchaceae archaeon HK02M1]|nr:dCTP deaminase [Candidatus Methylarchaceae archaeon HK02M1]
MILSNSDIHEYMRNKALIITPFDEEIVRENGIDLRLGNEIARLKRTDSIFDTQSDVDKPDQFFNREVANSFIINPYERLLICTFESVELKNGLMGFVNLRSSYARVGLTLPPTIIDVGFKGQLTIGVVGGAFPVRLYAGDRFFHVVLAKLTSDSFRYHGAYLGQRGVTYPKF